jgi:hypothetical protein
MDVPRRARLALAALALCALPLPARAEDDEQEDDAKGGLALAVAFEPSFARVEVSVRFDEGQPPSTVASDFAGLVTQERPYELTGFVLAPDRVLVSDPQLHPRFVSGIQVVGKDEKIPAKPVAWLASADGVLLALERPLEGAKPIAFAADAVPPFRAVWHGKHEGVWMTTVGPAARRVTRTEKGETWVDSWSPALLVDRAGKVAGLTLDDRVPVEGARGSPLDGPRVTAEEREALVAKAKALADAALLRVHLRLRSPKKEPGDRVMHRFRFGNDDEEDPNATERDAVGVAVGGKRVLVLETLEPKVTARLDAVEVRPADGDPIPATFVCSLRHYGALLVECDREVPVSVRLRAGSIRDVRNAFLLDARVEVQGESRVVHCGHARLGSFDEGWRGQLVPDVQGTVEHHFLFDREGALVALPIRRRLPDQERWRRDDVVLLPATYLAPVLAEPSAHADPANVPVAAERESRLAWLGVETQRLDRELARANSVSHLTQDGRTGALVSFVYPGSPAAKAGIEAGAVLLRVHVPDRPKPVDVASSEDSSPFSSMMEALDDEAGEAMEFMGFHPWPSAESEINRLLTDVGFGKTVGLEYATGGAVKRVDLAVEEGPVHHEAAPLRKSESLGTTVRDLTYEVRRYYQLDDSVSGVIVSKVERGTRAAVAGLRRFDIVLRVDDQPVPDVAAFEKATEKGAALRLTVKDRLKERVVKIAEAKPAEK